MREPKWVLRSIIDAMHDMQLTEHGGLSGLRDEGMLSSALARPVNLFTYGENDIFKLAASYAYGIAKNHPYVDGNKRTAFLAAYVFLLINGFDLKADEAVTTIFVQDIAAGKLDEEEIALWFKRHV